MNLPIEAWKGEGGKKPTSSNGSPTGAAQWNRRDGGERCGWGLV